MPSRKATGAEWAAMNSPTIEDHASITSLSRNRSFKPSFCINAGNNCEVGCQRSRDGALSRSPRHSWMTAARKEEVIGMMECWSNGIMNPL